MSRFAATTRHPAANVHDARLHSIGGECILDCVTHHGSFHDVPARVLAAETPRPGPFAWDGALRRFGGTEAGS